MLRRTLLGVGLIAATLVPVPASAATVTIEMYNHYFQPTAVVAATGDTIVLRNLGSRKVVQSWSNDQLPATTIENGATVSFVFQGPETGIRADDLDPQTPALSSVQNDTCTGMCGRITTTAPQNLPQPPVFSSPAAGSTVGTTVTFAGTALNATKIRLKIGSLTRTATVDDAGAWSLTQSLANGGHSASAVSIHAQGFESAPSTVAFTVAGGDTQPPRLLAGPPGWVAGQPTPARYGSVYVATGAIKVNGVVEDDVVAKSVTATIKDAITPDAAVPVTLSCVIPGGERVPCDAASNPQRIQYFGTYLPTRPGHYILTTTATDAVGFSTTVIQDVVIVSPF